MGTLIKAVSEYKRYGSFAELQEFIEIPDIQRDLMPKQVHSMKLHIKDRVEKGLEPIFGTIDLASVKGNPKLYICDGQHRIESIRDTFLKDKIIVPIHTMIYFVDTYEEMEEIYKVRNLGVPVPDYFLDLKNKVNLKKDVLKDIREYLERDDNKVFRYRVSHRPYININTFLEIFVKSKLYVIIDTIHDFGKVFDLLNTEAYNFIHRLDEKGKRKYGITSNMMSVWDDAGVYIAYDYNFQYLDKDYDISRFKILLNKI